MKSTRDQILTVAERLLSPDTVVNAVGEHDAASLFRGLAGTALLHARLSHLDRRFGLAARFHWTVAAKRANRQGVGFSGIHGGQGGVAASLIIGTRYLPDRHLLRAATSGVTWLSKCASEMSDLYRRTDILSWDVYDAITGLAGVGRVLLAAHQDGHTDAEPGLESALSTLTTILEPRDANRPGWWMAHENHPSATSIHPSGAATTGLAHGVAGPLAFLATAHLAGWSIPGQTEAIDHAAAWLQRWQQHDQTWPPAVTGDELDSDTPPATTGRTDAWCYGTPGIARALAQAGAALGYPEMRSAAESALDIMATRDPSTWDVEGPTICHGYAGILQSVPHHHPVAKAALDATVSSFDLTHKFGFRHRHRAQEHDEPGLLTGAAGIALSLADHERLPCTSTSTRWDSLLNLS